MTWIPQETKQIHRDGPGFSVFAGSFACCSSANLFGFGTWEA